MSRSLTIVAILASLTLGGCVGGTGGSGLIDLSAYQRGKLHYNAGQFGLAVKHFQSAVKREPASIEALNGLAASYDRLGRYDLSARYYERALGADPESTQTLNNIGYSYLLQERFDLAVAYLRDAQARDKKDPVMLANRMAAENSYREVDLKRSAEDARANAKRPTTVEAATVEAASSRPQVAVKSPDSQAPEASSKRVKPWIERTAPRVQTLVTQPQVVLLDAVQEVGISPQLAAYRPQQPEASELLPSHAAAPMALDAGPSIDRGIAVGQEVRMAPVAPPRAPDQPRRVPMNAPVTGLAPVEVTVASLNPLSVLEGISDKGNDSTDSAVTSGLAPTGVTAASIDPLSFFEGTAREGPGSMDSAVVAGSASIERVVASLDPAIEFSDVAPIEESPASVAASMSIAPEVALSDIDPLDALEDSAFGAENGSPQQAAAIEPPEFEVAALGAAGPEVPRVDAGIATPGLASLPLLEVSNGTGRIDMAARIREHLEARGIVVKRLTNAGHYRHRETTIFYRSGWRSYAEELAQMLPAVIDLDGDPDQESDVRLELGGDLLEFDRGLYYAVKRSNGANPG